MTPFSPLIPIFSFAPLDAQSVATSPSFPVRTILSFQHLNRGWITDTMPHLCNSWSCSWSLFSLFVRPETSLQHISVRPQKELSPLLCRGTRIEHFHKSCFKISHPSFHFIPTTAPDYRFPSVLTLWLHTASLHLKDL